MWQFNCNMLHKGGLNLSKKFFHKSINSTKKVSTAVPLHWDLLYGTAVLTCQSHSLHHHDIELFCPWVAPKGLLMAPRWNMTISFLTKNLCKIHITYWKTKGCQKNLSLISYLSSVAASTGHICKRVPKQSSCERERLSLKRVSNSWCLFVSLSMSSSVSCTKTYMK